MNILHSLTCGRSPSYHRKNLMKIVIIALTIYWLWEPIRPVRNVTATALSTVAEIITR